MSEKLKWYYFYTNEYEEWHTHLQNRLEPTFQTVPIKLESIDIHNSHPFHHFTGSTTKVKLLINAIKENFGKKIVFSDVTWIINKEKVNELNQIMLDCKETTYAQNAEQLDTINIGLILVNCNLEALQLWSYCLGKLEGDPNLHDQSIIDFTVKNKKLFNPEKIRAWLVQKPEDFQGYIALKLFTPSSWDHAGRYKWRMDTIKNFNIDF